jgi:hypothetical protein
MIVREYESKSHNICEACGEPGDMNSLKGYMFVACEKHNRKDKV